VTVDEILRLPLASIDEIHEPIKVVNGPTTPLIVGTTREGEMVRAVVSSHYDVQRFFGGGTEAAKVPLPVTWGAQ
jgi:hypothetical protein